MTDAATALNAAVLNHEVVARNLAHATVPGYKQQGSVFHVPNAAAGENAVGAPAPFTDFSPGPLQFTGAPLDLAADGDGFFVLAGPDGPVYTRNGTFRLNADGTIVSQGGYALQGAGGPLTVPPDAAVITIARDGSVSAGGQEIGRIQLTRFADRTKLTPVGPTLFRAGPGSGPSNAEGGILQGYREGSNVQPAEAMVAMIAGARQFEASQRALRTIADTVQLNTRPQG